MSVPNGATSAKKYIKQNIEFVESFEEIVLSFDMDEQGRKATEEVAQLLTPGKVKIADWSPYKDPNEMLQAGQGSEISQRIFNAKLYRPDWYRSRERYYPLRSFFKMKTTTPTSFLILN